MAFLQGTQRSAGSVLWHRLPRDRGRKRAVREGRQEGGDIVRDAQGTGRPPCHLPGGPHAQPRSRLCPGLCRPSCPSLHRPHCVPSLPAGPTLPSCPKRRPPPQPPRLPAPWLPPSRGAGRMPFSEVLTGHFSLQLARESPEPKGALVRAVQRKPAAGWARMGFRGCLA